MVEMTLEQQLSLPATYGQEMTPEVARKVADLKASIDMHDKNKVDAYGVEQQAQVGKFYDSILQGVGTKEVGDAGELLLQVVGDINGYQIDCEDENKGLLGFLRKQKSKLKNLQNKYKSIADNMDNVIATLKKKDIEVRKVSSDFDGMFETNVAMYEFLTMMIYAGEEALKEEKAKVPELQKAAEASGDLMKVQEVSDFKDDILKFERRIYDLKLARQISIDQAPQIRNVQKGAENVSEGIRRAMLTTIPLWKSQMAIAVGMKIVNSGLNAVNALNDATNAMLIRNSEMNKQLTLNAARAAERGVVDIETINIINKNAIEAINGEYEIIQQAITAREEGAKQLQLREAELKEAKVRAISLT